VEARAIQAAGGAMLGPRLAGVLVRIRFMMRSG